jgi:hypothetical protein
MAAWSLPSHKRVNGFSVRRFTAALVVLVCLSAPVMGASGTAASSGANAGSIGPTDSGVHAQTGSLVAPNGSVQINETDSNRTRIVLESVTLPQNGYIVARTGNLSANRSTTEVVGHTQYVRGGSCQGVVLNLNETIAAPATLTVTLHNDTNGNRTLDVASAEDGPYRSANGTPISDSVRLGTNQSQNQNTTASVVFTNL